MVWHAFDALDDSLDATKRLLLPFSLRRWLVLAVVAFFVSGTTGYNLDLNLGTWDGDVPRFIRGGTDLLGGAPELVVALLVAVVVLLVLLALLYVAAVMEFVFVEIATTQDVRLRGFLEESTRRGLSLFGLRLVIGLVSLAGVVFFGAIAAVGNTALLVALVLLLPLAVLFGIGLWVFARLTTDFVVPVMIAGDVGVVEGWRSFWPALTADWKQYALYVVVRALLGAMAAVVTGIGFGVVALVLGVPIALGGIVLHLLLGSVFGIQALELIAIVGLGAPVRRRGRRQHDADSGSRPNVPPVLRPVRPRCGHATIRSRRRAPIENRGAERV